EDTALQTLERWAERAGVAGHDPALWDQALDMLRDHEAHAAPLTEALKGEYFTLVSAIQNPGLVSQSIDNTPQEQLHDRSVRLRRAAREAAATVPWEADRTARLVGALMGGYLRAAETPYPRLAETMT